VAEKSKSHFHLKRAKSSRYLESRRRMEERLILQKNHAMQRSERNSEIVIETIRSVDLLERRRVANDLAWKAKWDTITAKLGRKAERCRYLLQIAQLLLLR
jgi:hypothetical protein